MLVRTAGQPSASGTEGNLAGPQRGPRSEQGAGAHGCGASAGRPSGDEGSELTEGRLGRRWLGPGWPGPGGGPRGQGGRATSVKPGASSGSHGDAGRRPRVPVSRERRRFAHSLLSVLSASPAGRAVTTPFSSRGNRLRRLNRFPGGRPEQQQAGLGLGAGGWGLSRTPTVP